MAMEPPSPYGDRQDREDRIRRRERLDAARGARQIDANVGCLLWSIPIGGAAIGLIAISDAIAASPWWTRSIAGLAPEPIARSASESWWWAVLVGVAVFLPFWAAASLVRRLRTSVAVQVRRGWLRGLARWVFLVAATALRAAVWLGGLATAYHVVRLLMGTPPTAFALGAGDAVYLAVTLVVLASAIRAVALHRQLPRAPA